MVQSAWSCPTRLLNESSKLSADPRKPEFIARLS
jgi:hypothetical protein